MSSAPDVIRIVVVDDHDRVRAELRRLLDAEPDMGVVGEAPDGPAAITLCAATAPDVVVMDLRLPGMSGVDAAERIRAAHPFIQVVACTAALDVRAAARLSVAGAHGPVFKDEPPQVLVDAVRSAAALAQPR